ncbi:MAG: cache domain-containing protein, partial [Lachnospiraceae bacterium]|nr:cache domain-containing protein [Lachnospiraceae bacterium]
MKKRKTLPIKAQLLIISIVPVLLIGIVLLSVSAVSLKKGMMEQALEGLMASAELFKTEVLTTGRDLSTNELEDEYKQATGFDFTRFEGDTRATTSVKKADGTRPVGTKASAEVIDAVINHGQTYVSEKTDVAGSEYCVAYTPIKDESGKVTGMAFAGKPTADIEKTITQSVTVIVVIGIIMIIITIVVVYMLANKLVQAVAAVSTVIGYLSNGEFEKTETMTDRGDELGDMIRSSNSLIDSLMNVVDGVKNAAGTVGKKAAELSHTTSQISDTTDGVSESVQEIAKGASEQAYSVEKITQNISNLSEAIHTVANNAEQLASSTSGMDTASKESARALGQLSVNMESMGKAVAEISASMKDTNRAVQSVNEKVDGITSIASQTNLLALNASIEAARAGE